MINLNKFVVSLLNSPELTKAEKRILHHALQEQGLRVKDGEIVSVAQDVAERNFPELAEKYFESEDLETELDKYIKDHFTIDKEQLDRFGLEEKNYMYSMDKSDMLAMVRHFVNWQKEQILAKAVDVEVKVDAGGYPYIPQIELYDYDKDIPLAKEGDKYKVILIKED